MLTEKQIKFNQAKRRYMMAVTRFEKIYSLYRNASFELKQQFDLSEIDVSDISFIYYGNDLSEIIKKDYFTDADTVMDEEQKNDETIDLNYDNFMEAALELQSAVEELKDCNNALDDPDYSQIDRSFLDRSLSGEIVDVAHYDTSILDNYRPNWGIERICLDGMQNHLRADSKGNLSILQFYIDGKWCDYEEASQNRDRITQIRFADDGVGFDSQNLVYLSSQKDSEDLSAGQFGEGLKIIAMASVRLGLEMEIQSKNWSARAYGKTKPMKNYRSGEEKVDERQQLAWEVLTYDGEPLKGSRTIFHNPSPELIDYALKLPEYILELTNKKPVANLNKLHVVSTEDGGKGYSKGIFVSNINTLFSYDFEDIKLNPDRNQFFSEGYGNPVIDEIKWELVRYPNYRIIKPLLKNIIEYYNENIKGTTEEEPYECCLHEDLKRVLEGEYSNYGPEYVAYLWRKAFEDIYKEEIEQEGLEGVVLKTDHKQLPGLEEALKKYKVITLPKEWTDVLELAGVKTDKSIVPDFIEKKLITSLTLGYGEEKWGLKKILIDTCQNHLPSDSQGTQILVRFQTRDGGWHFNTEFEQYSDSEIVKIKVCDNGVGYDYKNLELLATTKDDANGRTVGKWGEGLKMVAAAALRNGVKIQFHSRNWQAEPFIEDDILNEGEKNEKRIKKLGFNVRINYKDDLEELQDGDWSVNKHIKSSTTFIDPPPDLIKEFRHLEENVLAFSNVPPMFEGENADILDWVNRNLYINGMIVPGENQTKYSWHFKNFSIESRDRDIIRTKSIREQIAVFLNKTTNINFMKMFLLDASNYAKQPNGQSYPEFDNSTNLYIPSYSENSDLWIQAFQEFFGENACIRQMSSQDGSEFGQSEHLGLNLVTLPDNIAIGLMNTVARDGKRIKSYQEVLQDAISNTVPVDDMELTEEEKAIIQQLYSYNKVLKLTGAPNEIEKIEVYDYPQDYKKSGRVMAAGFARYGNIIHIARDTLKRGLRYSSDVFFHEATHAETGERDESPGFRDFLSDAVGRLSMATCELDKSVIQNGMAKGIRFPVFQNIIKKILWRMIEKDAKTNEKAEKEVGD